MEKLKDQCFIYAVMDNFALSLFLGFMQGLGAYLDTTSEAFILNLICVDARPGCAWPVVYLGV